MNHDDSLPPGQKAIDRFPRFGLTMYANRFPRDIGELSLAVTGEACAPVTLCASDLVGVARVAQVSNFHCVTTWSRRDVEWGGYRFRDVYEQVIAPRTNPAEEVAWLVFVGLDGYRSPMRLEHLLEENVLLADTLDGEPLPSKHGAPLRLVAPAHYGYKNVKHLKRIELHASRPELVPWHLRFLDHPEGRVDREQRGRGLPGWVYRYLYRPMIRPTERAHARGMERGQGEGRRA